MGKKREKHPTATRSSSYQTPPSSPSHSFSSSSSSDFEFTISLSPRTNSFNTSLCPADELFYKGLVLPLQLSPRISMVRALSLASSSGFDSTATASRDSTASSSSSSVDQYYPTDPSSCRPSSVADDEDQLPHRRLSALTKKNKYFSLSKFSSVFKEESKNNESLSDVGSGPGKRMSSSAREVLTKYLKKVKPLYEKLSSQPTKIRSDRKTPTCDVVSSDKSDNNNNSNGSRGGRGFSSHSFSGSLQRYPMGGKKWENVSSCPSSMRSSPINSGLLSRNFANGFPTPATGCSSSGGITRANRGGGFGSVYHGGGGGDTASSMEELQSAIQGAIAHCKNSLLQEKTGSSPSPTLIMINQ